MHPSKPCSSSLVSLPGVSGPEQLLKLSKQSSKPDPAQRARNERTRACKALAQMVQLGRAAMLRRSVWSPSVPYVACHLKWAGGWPAILCVCVPWHITAEIRLNSSLLGLLDPKGCVTCETGDEDPYLLGTKQPECLSMPGFIYRVYCFVGTGVQRG